MRLGTCKIRIVRPFIFLISVLLINNLLYVCPNQNPYKNPKLGSFMIMNVAATNKER